MGFVWVVAKHNNVYAVLTVIGHNNYEKNNYCFVLFVVVDNNSQINDKWLQYYNLYWSRQEQRILK